MKDSFEKTTLNSGVENAMPNTFQRLDTKAASIALSNLKILLKGLEEKYNSQNSFSWWNPRNAVKKTEVAEMLAAVEQLKNKLRNQEVVVTWTLKKDSDAFKTSFTNQLDENSELYNCAKTLKSIMERDIFKPRADASAQPK